MTRVKLFPADMGGCGYYRIIWPGQALAAQGADVDVVLPTEPDERQINAQWLHIDRDDRKLVSIAPITDADVVVIQRPLQDTNALAIPMIQAQGIKVVVEIDDDFEALSRRNASWPNVQPHLSPRRNKQWLKLACETADLVVCSTPALAERYARHGRVRIVRNRVPAWYLDVEREPHDGVFVGWSGSIDTHPDDLQVTGGGVARAVKAAGATFAVVGTGKGVQRALGLADPVVATGWLPIEEYPKAVAQLDVGIVPLELTPFNAAKSALKMMEMAALGVVPVVSPTPENLRMAGRGIGVAVRTPRGWEGALKQFAREPEVLALAARQWRASMRAHTIESNLDDWHSAWTSAVNTKAGAHR